MAPFARKRPFAHEKDPNYKFGRPEDYRPEYCAQVEECMGRGLSLTAFAGKIGHHKATVYRWLEAHPEFSEAVERARAKRIVPWEEKLLKCDKGAEVAATIFALKNCDPDEWREVRYANFDHNVNISTLSDEQLLAIASGRQPAAVGAIDVQYNRLIERPRRYEDPAKRKK
jgi:hypothetical protein